MKLKAAQSRLFLEILYETLDKYWEKDSEYAKVRFACLVHLRDTYQEIANWDNDLSPQRLGASCRKHLILIKELKRMKNQPLRWEFIPKHHLWIHLCEEASNSPILEWAYCDESEIGKAVKAAKHTSLAFFETSYMERYRTSYRWL